MPQMEEAIRAVAARFRLRAVALATYNPDCDQDEKTLRAGLRIMELLAECASLPRAEQQPREDNMLD